MAIKYDPVLLDKYRRVLKNCGSKKKAIVAVARKISDTAALDFIERRAVCHWVME